MEKIKGRGSRASPTTAVRGPARVELLNEKLGDLSRTARLVRVGRRHAQGDADPPRLRAPRPQGAPEEKPLPPSSGRAGPEADPRRRGPGAAALDRGPGPAADPRPPRDWVAHLEEQLDPGARARLEQMAEGKTAAAADGPVPRRLRPRRQGPSAPRSRPRAPRQPPTGSPSESSPPPAPRAGSSSRIRRTGPPSAPALHDQLIENAKAQARAFADQLLGKETHALSRCAANTAAGKDPRRHRPRRGARQGRCRRPRICPTARSTPTTSRPT